jgi:hypothetical protein
MAALLALLVAAPVLAQNQRMYSQPELDQMLAPIALYPDPLLSQILMAATYPDEVHEAAAWSRANPDLQGDAAVRAVQFEDWDPSVKSLAAFPQVLARMAESPQWMQALGEAFLTQEPHVMDAVQQLRRRAQAAGNLQSSEQLQVQQQGPAIVIQPASPQVVYVPYYDPYVVYGRWWWPAYRPVVWSPWPWPYRVYLSAGFFFGNFDWHRRHVHVVHPAAYYYRHRHAHAVATDRGIAFSPQRWRHEPQRRAAHAERRAMPVQVPVRPNVQSHAPAPRHETRTEHRIEQRVERRQERREERRDERPDERRQLRQGQPSAPPVAPVVRTPAPVQLAPAPAPVLAAPAVRMPAASAPPQPRAERREQHREQRQERREQRQEQRGQKG